jgi:diguanylate cyclase (GGDEF)-like protein
MVAIVRGAFTSLENVTMLRRVHGLAHTDALSRLPNRRQLIADLESALGGGAATTTTRTLVFFDLDGFKHYNDEFGHAAGDQLLERLARRLESAVEGDGTAYRLGGDEFCVLLENLDSAVVERAVLALEDRGDGFSIGSSHGVVRLPEEAQEPSEALRLADQRMYANKRSSRPSDSRQARDVLLTLLDERDSRLHEHVDSVSHLAQRVGVRMGMQGEELDVLVRAAELHDVGKVAIPEQVLDKPGPLDSAEWRLLRQHTIVGERILAAAPALRPVAEVVRASHERWDGAGYPDGLAGAEIPLAARIVGVCDAFDAMVTERVYRPADTVEQALEELRRCAGGQFDPAVVDAFCAEIAELDRERSGAGERQGQI